MELAINIYIGITIAIFIIVAVLKALEYATTKPSWKERYPETPAFTTLAAETIVFTILWPIIGIAVLIKQLIKK